MPKEIVCLEIATLFKFKFFKTISCKSNINLYIFFLFFSTKCRVILFWCFCWITLSVGDTTFVEEAPGSPTHAFASLVGVANSNTLEVAPRNVCWFLKKNRCYWDCKSNINLYIFFSYFLKLNASCVFLHTIVLFSVCFFFINFFVLFVPFESIFVQFEYLKNP